MGIKRKNGRRTNQETKGEPGIGMMKRSLSAETQESLLERKETGIQRAKLIIINCQLTT